MTISFKTFHGKPFFKFNIYSQSKITKKRKRIGRMIAPNKSLAIAKSYELWQLDKNEKLTVLEVRDAKKRSDPAYKKSNKKN